MEALTNALLKVTRVFSPGIDLIKRRIFGANNERLDFIMDSFYKLSPQHQTGVLAGLGSLLTLMVVLIFGIYFSRIATLEEELDSGFRALRDIRKLSVEYKQEKARMEWLVRSVENKNTDFRAKPFFEKKANQIGVTLESLRSEEVEIAKGSQLANTFKEVQISFRMPKVSIPRLLNFMSEIEKSGNMLTVRTLRIRARYGDRLFFDTEAQVSGYIKL